MLFLSNSYRPNIVNKTIELGLCKNVSLIFSDSSSEIFRHTLVGDESPNCCFNNSTVFFSWTRASCPVAKS